MAKDQVQGNENFEIIFNEIKNESDRAAVILSAARIEDLLHQLLASLFLPSTENNDELLGMDKPLSTFSAKIKISYRLGLIDKRFVSALNIIRKIRNSFAHETSSSSLGAFPHRDMIRSLKKLFCYEDKFDSLKKVFFLEGDHPAIDFRLAITLILMRLEGAINNTNTIYNEDPFTLIPENFRDIVDKVNARFMEVMSNVEITGSPTSTAK